MDKKTDIEDRGSNLCAPQVDGRVDGNEEYNAKRHLQQKDIQQEITTPRFELFSNSTGNASSKGHRSIEKASGATAASTVLRSKSMYLRPGDRRCLFSSAKKNFQRGPLKKRSPKLSPSVPSRHSVFAPVSTPFPPTFPPDLYRFQTSSSGFSSLGSISSASTLHRRRLPMSVLKNGQKESTYNLPVKRNLSEQLMAEAILTTPNTVSSTGGRPHFSNNTLLFSNPRHASSNTPIPFSFSKKRKLPNPVVTNILKINSASRFISKPPDTDEIRGQETRHVSDYRADNQARDKTKTKGRPSQAINILRIIDPFGNYPRVTVKRSAHALISSPLADLPKTPSKNNGHSDRHLNATGTKTKETMIREKKLSKSGDSRIQRHLLFSPLVRYHEAPFDANTPVRHPPVESIATKIMPRGKKNSKSKKPKVVNQTLNRSDLFQNVRTTTRPCKCKKTNCLKLYCECYRSASFCDPDLCYCIGCLNTEAHNSTEEPRGRRVLAMLVALAKKPDAFDGGGRKFNTKGCRCTKSRYVRSSINLVWLNLLVILLTPSILFNLSLIVF